MKKHTLIVEAEIGSQVPEIVHGSFDDWIPLNVGDYFYKNRCNYIVKYKVYYPGSNTLSIVVAKTIHMAQLQKDMNS